MLQADFFQRDQIVRQSTFSFEHSGIGTLKLTQWCKHTIVQTRNYRGSTETMKTKKNF